MSPWISPDAVLFALHFDRKYESPEPGELEFLLRRIAKGGEPVLELGSGTGRVLIPLLERGIDITGIDVSPGMLERCRERCRDRDLPVELHAQSMEALDLPRRFGTVFMGSCGLGVLTTEDDVRATFRGVFEHLRAGGVFSFEIQTPPTSGPTIDRAGIWTGDWNTLEDGSILTVRHAHRYDPDTHVRPSVMILEHYVEGRLEASEVHDGTMRFWEAETAVRHLTDAGFVDGVTSNVFTDGDSPEGHTWLVVRARRP